jgi:hypothetical protein
MEIATSLIRHALTVGGGGLVSKGLISEDMLTSGIGAVVTLVGIIWSVVSKLKAKKQ